MPFLDRSAEGEDILDGFISSLRSFLIHYPPGETEQCIEATENTIKGILKKDSTVWTISKPTNGIDNLIVKDNELEDELVKLEPQSMDRSTSMNIADRTFIIRSYVVFEGKKYYVMIPF